MKTIIFFFLVSVISCNSPITQTKSDSKEILLYFINDKTLTLRPGQITEAEFWGNPGIDTFKLQDFTREYITRFQSLQDTVLHSSDEVDLFHHAFAFVFTNVNKNPDTIYADKMLKLFEWKGKKKFCKDTTSFFNDKFYTLVNVN